MVISGGAHLSYRIIIHKKTIKALIKASCGAHILLQGSHFYKRVHDTWFVCYNLNFTSLQSLKSAELLKEPTLAEI